MPLGKELYVFVNLLKATFTIFILKKNSVLLCNWGSSLWRRVVGLGILLLLCMGMLYFVCVFVLTKKSESVMYLYFILFWWIVFLLCTAFLSVLF